MTVMHITTSRPKPGRQAEAIALGARAGQLMRRAGARDCRLLIADIGGESTGTQSFTAQFDSHEDFAAASEKMMNDPALEALLDGVSGPNAVVTLESQSLAVEIPIGRTPKPGRGPIVSVFISRVKPGMLAASLDLAREAFDFVEEHGGMNPSLWVQTVAGMATDLYAVAWEYDSLRTWGKASDAYAVVPKGQQLAQRLQSADAPTVMVSAQLMREIPI